MHDAIQAVLPAGGSPLRIALFTHSVNPRGGVVHTVELGEALQAQGHDVTLFMPAAPGEALFRRCTCRQVLIAVPPAAADTQAMAGERIRALEAALPAYLTEQPFDILHAQDSLSGNALATLHAQRHIGPWWRTVHHLDDFTRPQLRMWQARAFLEARHVLCVSETWRTRLHQQFGVAAWRVGNGVALQRFSARLQPEDVTLAQRLGLVPRGQRSAAAPVLLAVGGVEERKNTARIVRALAALRQQRPGARLLIAGGASLLQHGVAHRQYIDALRDTGLRDGPGEAVERLGVVADTEMAALYRLTDALLMPSLNEGFGLVVLEALACATPVVVSRRPPFNEHLSGPGVHWCDPEQIEDIAQAAQAALDHPLAAIPALCHAFGWDRSAQYHAHLYQNLSRPMNTPIAAALVAPAS